MGLWRGMRMAAVVLAAYVVAASPVPGAGGTIPSIMGSLRFEGSAIAVAASGKLAFVVTAKGGDAGEEVTLEIVSVADPRKPVRTASVALGRRSGSAGVLAVGHWVFVQADGSVLAFDVADPANPIQVDRARVPVAARPGSDAEVHAATSRFGDLLFTAVGGGVRAERLRIAGPTTPAGSPVMIATPGKAQDVVALGDLLFVADGPGVGLTVLRLVPNPTVYEGSTIVGRVSVPTAGSAEAVAVAGGLALVADGLEGLTIISGPIPPGTVLAVVPTPGRAVDVAATGDSAIVATEEEGIQVIALPAVSAPLVVAGMIPERVENVRVTNISPDTTAIPPPVATYTLSFTAPLRGGLAASDTITVAFPPGCGLGRVAVTLNGAAVPPANVTTAAGAVTIALPQKLVIPGGSVVTLTFAGVVNPPRGTSYVLTVFTTASPTPVASDPFTIGEDTLAWLNVNLAVPLVSIEALLEGVNDRLDDKIALENQLLDDLEDLAGMLIDVHDYLHEELQVEWELLDVADEILAGVQKKIDLEIAIRNALDALRKCLRQFELTGTLTPPIEPRSPIDLILALDSSGSMADNDPKRIAISGAKVFVDELDSARDRVGVVSWDDKVDFTKALSSVFPQVKRDLEGVDQDGGTDFDVGLKAALDLLKAARPGSRKVVVFLTDGKGNYTLPGKAGSLVDRASADGVVIYAIGLGTAPDMALLRDMAEATGGKAFHAKQAADLVAVYAGITQALMNPWQVRLRAMCQ